MQTGDQTSQINKMKDYLANLNIVLESTLTELLLEQPEDPAQVLANKLLELPGDVLERLKESIVSNKGAKEFPVNPQRPMEIPYKFGICDTLHLNIDSLADKPIAVSALQELKKDALLTGQCLSFHVYFDASKHDFFVEQIWMTAEALADFLKSDAFQRFFPKWRGILTKPPTNQQYAEKIM